MTETVTKEASAEFELLCGDEFAASASGPRERVWKDILHYAAQYAEDGPLTVYEVTRREVPLTTEVPEVEACRSLPVDGGVEHDDSWVAQVVSSGPHDFPLLQWRNADVSFSVPIGSKLYAALPSPQPSGATADLLTETLRVLEEIALDGAQTQLDEYRKLYSATYKPHRVDCAERELLEVRTLIARVRAALKGGQE